MKDDLASLQSLVESLTLADILSVPSTIMLIAIINRINRMQNTQAKEDGCPSNKNSNSDYCSQESYASCPPRNESAPQSTKGQINLNSTELNQDKIYIPPLLDEEKAWEQALTEFESDERKKGVWAKAFSDSNGDEAKAKAQYLKIRAKQLIDSHYQYTQELHDLEERRKKEEAELQRYESTKKIKKICNREYSEFEDGTCEIVTRWGEKKIFPNVESLRKYIGCS
jgi:hypothetical protein